MWQVKVILLLCFTSTIIAAKFPSTIKRCKPGDHECMLQVTNMILDNEFNGHSGLNLVPLDPLHIPEIRLKQGAESPVNIDLKFKNVSLFGIKDFKAYKMSGFEKNINGEHEIRFKGPIITLTGPYTISGRVLILPIQGEGQTNLTMTNPDVVLKFDAKSVERNGKIYMEPENFRLTLQIKRLYMRLENLYNGDKLLGDSTNLFLNENWQDIYNELKKSIFDAFGLILGNVVTNVFRKYPYSEYFTDQ